MSSNRKFEFRGVQLQEVESESCLGCFFYHNRTYNCCGNERYEIPSCCGLRRSDNKDVKFVQI